MFAGTPFTRQEPPLSLTPNAAANGHEAWPSLEAEGGPDGPDGDPRGLGDGEPEPIALLEGLRFLNRHD